jgi:hypothetical protein
MRVPCTPFRDRQEKRQSLRSYLAALCFAGPAALDALGLDIPKDHLFRFRPDASSTPQAVNQATVASQKDACPMVGKTEFVPKPFDFFEKQICHAATIARDSVQVNARHNVSASFLLPCKNQPMKIGWFDRLKAAIESDDRSYSQISEAAGLGRNYVQQMIKNGKQPTGDKLGKILETMPSEKAMFILIGMELRDEDVEFLNLVRRLDPDAREDVRRFLHRFADDTEPAG